MSTVTLSKLSAAGIVRSEWIKLRTLRSTVWSLIIVIVLSFGFSALFATAYSSSGGRFAIADTKDLAITVATSGINLVQLVVAVLGALIITGEYSTGMIRSTFAAVPHRLPALAAKAFVLFVTTFIVGAISTFGSYFIVSPILANKGVTSNLSDSSVWLPLLGGALYLACVALFALAVGTIIRNSAGGIAAALGVILVLPILVRIIPADWATDLSHYLISSGGSGFYSPGSEFTIWQNLAVVLSWLIVSLGAAAVLLKRRDA